MSNNLNLIRSLIREVPDFPKPGILFYDISTVLQDDAGLKASIDLMAEQLQPNSFDKFLAIESRGFIFGAALADRFGKGMILARKIGKLPGTTMGVDYSLEYGKASIEITDVAIKRGERVIIVDDLLATGGTARAAANLLEKAGAKVVKALFLIELAELKGRANLNGIDLVSVLKY